MEALIRFGYETIGTPKFAAVFLLFLIYIFKVLKDHLDQTQAQRTNRISEMLMEIEKLNPPRYNFTVEQVFQNRFGFLIDYPVINFFLKQKTPSSDIYDYIRGFKYIEYCEASKRIRYKGKYTDSKLKMAYYLALSGYFIFAFSGLGLIALLPKVGVESSTSFAIYLFMILLSLIMSYLFLTDATRPKSAISLVTRYNKKFERDGLSPAPQLNR